MTSEGGDPDSKLAPPLPELDIFLFVAIEELDALISELLSEGKYFISPHFHDWVADSLTTTVEARLLAALQTRRFKDSLSLGTSRTVLAHWVRNWTCLEIKQHFGQYAEFCPCAKLAVPQRVVFTATPTSSDISLPIATDGTSL